MNLTRRLILRNAAFSAIAANLYPVAFAQKHLIGQDEAFNDENLATLDGLSMQSFEAWIGSSFHASLNRKPMGALTLLSVEDMSAKTSDAPASGVLAGPTGQILPPGREPAANFSLHFRSSEVVFAQDTYLLSHDWLGTFPLFLVPSGPATRRPTCTAVFNQLDRPGGRPE
jgi:hypothetical protein